MPDRKVPKPAVDYSDEREHRRQLANALNRLIEWLENGTKQAGPSVLDWLGW